MLDSSLRPSGHVSAHLHALTLGLVMLADRQRHPFRLNTAFSLARFRHHTPHQVQRVIDPRNHNIQQRQARHDNLVPLPLAQLLLCLLKVEITHLLQRPQVDRHLGNGLLRGAVDADPVPDLETGFCNPGDRYGVSVVAVRECAGEVVVLCFPTLERFEVNGFAVQRAFCADGDVHDCAGADAGRGGAVGGLSIVFELGLEDTEALGVERCEGIVGFFGYEVLEFAVGKVDLEMEARWCWRVSVRNLIRLLFQRGGHCIIRACIWE